MTNCKIVSSCNSLISSLDEHKYIQFIIRKVSNPFPQGVRSSDEGSLRFNVPYPLVRP